MSDWTRLKDEETLQLTEIYQDKGNSDSLRENAFHALCYRFKNDVLNKCEITSKRFGHDITVAELVATATFSSYAKKGDFQISKASIKNVDDAFKNYLYKIARNEFTNYYRQQQRKVNNPFDGSEEIVTELPNLKGTQLNMEQSIIIKAIESLTPAQRTVYLTYKKYEKLGFNLPKKLREELRAHLGGIEQSTVRTYKKEAIDKIKSYTEVMNLTKELSDGKI
jgi:RNA polymerase sigma factor (sigma-70 family)